MRIYILKTFLFLFFTQSVFAQISSEHEKIIPVLDHDLEYSETILRKAESDVGKMDLLLFLHTFKKTSLERDLEIQSLLTDLYEKSVKALGRDQFPVEALAPDYPFYNGKNNSIIPTIRLASSAGINTHSAFYAIPCSILKKNEALLDATEPYWGSNRDNFLPRSGCRWDRGEIENFPNEALEKFIEHSHLADGNFIRYHNGSVRFMHISANIYDIERLKIAPLELIKHKGYSDEYPYQFWAYLSQYNYRQYNLIKGHYQEAFAAIKNYYIEQFDLNSELSELAARNGLFSVAIGTFCEENIPSTSIRKLILEGADSDTIMDMLNREYATEFLPVNSFSTCSLSSGRNPLIHIATSNSEILEELISWQKSMKLEEGFQAEMDLELDVDAINNFGKTALMTAAQYDQIDSVKILISHGANINAKTDDQYDDDSSFKILEHDHRTPLMYAAGEASLEVIKILINNGADFSLKDSKGLNALDYLLGNGPVPKNPKLGEAEFENAKSLLQ